MASGQKGFLEDRMKICTVLWDAQIKVGALLWHPYSSALHLQAELIYKESPKLLSQFQYCEAEGIPWLVILGEEEKVKGSVRLRQVDSRVEVGWRSSANLYTSSLHTTILHYTTYVMLLTTIMHYQKGSNSIGKFGG